MRGDGAHLCMPSFFITSRLVVRQHLAIVQQEDPHTVSSVFSSLSYELSKHVKQRRNIFGQFGDTGDIHTLTAIFKDKKRVPVCISSDVRNKMTYPVAHKVGIIFFSDTFLKLHRDPSRKYSGSKWMDWYFFIPILSPLNREKTFLSKQFHEPGNINNNILFQHYRQE